MSAASFGTIQESSLLKKMMIRPSEESHDYVHKKTQFQLHTLLTEQRHPKTLHLSSAVQGDFQTGLQMLFSVDEDITAMLAALPKAQLVEAQEAMVRAIQSGRKIYFYGCGATGRLAKQMESTFWRPFWRKCQQHPVIWQKITSHYGEDIAERCIGEMTGGDRALISSLEGFEDLQLIGRLQLQDRGIVKGDAVFCVTEGGETSSVIGAIRTALSQWEGDGYDACEARKHLYFVYNNPDDKLLPFERSRVVLQEPGITKINLTTGPQSITGSTRMQATTSQTFVLANVMHAALDKLLRDALCEEEMRTLGFATSYAFEEGLGAFRQILKEVKSAIPRIAQLTALEAGTYESKHFSTYYADEALLTVFTDATERSPTFRLKPLDSMMQEERQCWIQVWTPSVSCEEAWQAFLGRQFRGLSSLYYQGPFSDQIEDHYLKDVALASLTQAGSDQQELYDFSFADFNMTHRGPKTGDMGLIILTASEAKELRPAAQNFCALFNQGARKLGVIAVTDKQDSEVKGDVYIPLLIDMANDPLGINQQIAIKILLNAHSTGMMAYLGKVIGNTMAYVSPTNLKLVGRATYLIQSHVNSVLENQNWILKYGKRNQITYAEANAVLFEAKRYVEENPSQSPAEVGLSIIQILESLKQNRAVRQEDAYRTLQQVGVGRYLEQALESEILL